MARQPRRLETLLLGVVIAVAALSLYRSQTSDLHRWKGGGFGMYTDPHPSRRMMWIEGEIAGEHTAFRVYPIDWRMAISGMRDSDLRRDLFHLEDLARDIRNYPARSDLADLTSQAQYLLQHHRGVPELAAIFPQTNVRFSVVEIRLAPGFDTLTTRPVSTNRPLW